MAIVTVKLGDYDNSEDVYEVPRETARAIQTVLEKPYTNTVIHAKWETVSTSLLPERKCSACGYSIDYYTAEKSLFCIHCGAKMDLNT